MTITQPSAVVSSAVHPRFCDPGLCQDMQTDIAHREEPVMFIARPGGEIAFIGINQWDEREHGRQVVHEADVELAATDTLHMSPDEAEHLADLLYATAARARTREPRP